ncbi:TetR/AcrR family transcriptional regulator [Desulfovibrio ferrophilus]|uniref:Transcriptional regulator, TetR family n=1 Tax=Desulfovibrio ferrophilus TaxID=241368 RepID=A0A2Z6AZM2_9BACT|nr:TetR/AcrR family transcriptional regulator [Desulfovibrio ferrophilus]BBD08699.1 transcriptional regulator, TetR family [Desulfovibrio ferrophilus]
MKTQKQGTRERIIEAGARIIHKNGFNNTGLKEILDAADIPKGSFYFYFKNKEDFGLQVVDHYVAHFGQMAMEILAGTDGSPLMRFRVLHEKFRDFYQAQECSLGCPVGNLAQEMGDLSPAFRKRLSNAIDGMASMYCSVLAEAQQAGALDPALDVREVSYFLVSGWHGALVRMKVTKDIEPLNLFMRMAFERVLGVPLPE